jgi:hypothetical protein
MNGVWTLKAKFGVEKVHCLSVAYFRHVWNVQTYIKWARMVSAWWTGNDGEEMIVVVVVTSPAQAGVKNDVRPRSAQFGIR